MGGGGGGRVGGRFGGSGLGVRVDVNEELKFLCKFKKKNLRGGRVGWGRSGRGEGVGWGQGGCERRFEVFVKIQKKNNWGGG